jgi:hypothetical protein
VRAVGDHTGVIYLSVSPHVEPTHTFYGPDGQRRQPRYGVWRAAGGGDADDTRVTTPTLLEGYREAAQRLAELAQASLERANAVNGKLNAPAPLKPTADDLWDALRPLLQQVEVVERTWNALAQRAGT